MNKDLVVLVADLDMEKTIEGLLKRPQSLGIRSVTFEIIRHPQRDNGCFNGAPELLTLYQATYQQALVMFDFDGSGQEARKLEDVQADLMRRLALKGWDEQRAGVVIIQPELEIWVWSDSSKVDECLGWANQTPDLRTWLREQALLKPDAMKPHDPKKAMLDALKEVKKRHSAAIFEDLARQVSLQRCTDTSFASLRSLLQSWFAPQP